MNDERYLGMRPGDLDGKPYAKYWKPDMAPMQRQNQDAIIHGPEASELGFRVDEIDRMLDPGYLPLESGFTRLPNGQLFMAHHTKMPGVKGYMIDWWMGWHYMENQRYKLWHPRSHISQRAERMIGDDASISDTEKYRNNPQYVTEYLGTESADLALTITEPGVFFDDSRFEEANIGTAVCCVCTLQEAPVTLGILIHLYRDTAEGCELRSRFWGGHIPAADISPEQIREAFAQSTLTGDQCMPLEMGRDLLAHNGTEYNHLASFLPDLYADYH